MIISDLSNFNRIYSLDTLLDCQEILVIDQDRPIRRINVAFDCEAKEGHWSFDFVDDNQGLLFYYWLIRIFQCIHQDDESTSKQQASATQHPRLQQSVLVE